MVTREEAKKRALDAINEIIKKEGWKSKGVMMVRKGKCAWTNNEVKQAILNDTNLFDGNIEIKNSNPIDSMYHYLQYAEKHNLT